MTLVNIRDFLSTSEENGICECWYFNLIICQILFLKQSAKWKKKKSKTKSSFCYIEGQ